jgi:ABC-type amino acid transport substrate-binding protein
VLSRPVTYALLAGFAALGAGREAVTLGRELAQNPADVGGWDQGLAVLVLQAMSAAPAARMSMVERGEVHAEAEALLAQAGPPSLEVHHERLLYAARFAADPVSAVVAVAAAAAPRFASATVDGYDAALATAHATAVAATGNATGAVAVITSLLHRARARQRSPHPLTVAALMCAHVAGDDLTAAQVNWVGCIFLKKSSHSKFNSRHLCGSPTTQIRPRLPPQLFSRSSIGK